MAYIRALVWKDSVRNTEKHSFGQTTDNRVLCLSKMEEESQPSSTVRGSIKLFLAQQPPVGRGVHIYEVSRSHTATHHSR